MTNLCSNTKHFFDIGGNIGQTFDWLTTLERDFSDYVFWVFEPSPRHFSKLLEKCKSLSSIYNIKVCPFGLGGKTDAIKFFEKDDSKGDSFEEWLKSDHEVSNINQGYEVVSCIISLPEFILTNTKANDEIFLDIDVEGSEYHMLESLIKNEEALKRVTEIVAEFHFIKNPERFFSKETIKKELEKHDIKLTMRGHA